MQSPKYESFFIINKRRQYEKSTITGHSLQLPYKSARDNLQSGKRLSVTSRCHRVLWEKDKENVVLGGVKSYFTGRKIAEQQIHPNRTTNTKNNYLSSLNRTHNGSVTARDNYLIDRSISYQNQSSTARKQLLRGFDQMAKSLYSQEQVESQVQLQIRPVTQELSDIAISKQTITVQEKGAFGYPLSYRYDYQARTKENQKVFESIIDRHNDLLENSLKVSSVVGNSLYHGDKSRQEIKEYKDGKGYQNQSWNEFNDNQSSIHSVASHPNSVASHLQSVASHPNSITNPNKKQPLKMDSSMTSNRSSKKSRILQFKQQFNNTLEQQQIIRTQIIPNKTANDQQSSLKSFTKDQLCSSFYEPEQEHAPHRLLVGNSNRKNNLLASQKKDVRNTASGENVKVNLVPMNNTYAMTVREHSVKSSSKEDVLQSRSMKDKPLERRVNDNCSEVHSGEIPQGTEETFCFTGVLTSQSQLIKPSKPRHSEQVIGVSVLGKKIPNLSSSQSKPNPLPRLQNNNPTLHAITVSSAFQKVLDLNPKPCQSFILQTTQQANELQAKQMGSFLEGFYEQQLKRRSEANQILKSLINMKMIHETMEVNPIN